MITKEEVYISEKDPLYQQALNHALAICPKSRFVDGITLFQWSDGALQFEIVESARKPGDNRVTYFMDAK